MLTIQMVLVLAALICTLATFAPRVALPWQLPVVLLCLALLL